MMESLMRRRELTRNLPIVQYSHITANFEWVRTVG